MATRRYRGYKITVERSGDTWDVTVFTPDGEKLWDEGEYTIYQDAFEEAHYVIDEEIEERTVPVVAGEEW